MTRSSVAITNPSPTIATELRYPTEPLAPSLSTSKRPRGKSKSASTAEAITIGQSDPVAPVIEAPEPQSTAKHRMVLPSLDTDPSTASE
ncbi:MAG: hypothetical protein QM784_05970 [Polyangiaceae bacterium]